MIIILHLLEIIVFLYSNFENMKKRIIITTIAIVTAIVALLFIQVFWNEMMFREEQKLIKAKASSLLQDVLGFHIHKAVMDRYVILESAGLLGAGEVRGGDFEKKTITVRKVYPEPVTIVRQCKTEEEWYEYIKDIRCRYHYTGINLNRLDSTFKSHLESDGITLPYVLALMDSSGAVLNQTPHDVDFNRYQLSLDTIPLGIDDKDFLVARFDGSYFGLYRQMKAMSSVSLGIGFLLIFILIYTGLTVYYQKKRDEMILKNQKNIAHNLMNQQVYFGKALSKIEVSEPQQKYIHTMKQKNTWMSLLIDKLQRTSLSSTTIDIYPETVCINELISDITDQFQAEHEKCKFHFEHDDTQPITASVDLVHFGYALINLIENAVKYSGKNPEIHVGCHVDENKIYVTVKDRGIGIDAAHLRKIFDRNYRIPESEALSQKGFGLGLYYVKLVAKSHGGDVAVESEYKKGSTFILTIPN